MLALILTILVMGFLHASLSRTAVTDGIARWGCLVIFVGLLWRLSQTPCLYCRRPLGVSSLFWIGRADPLNPPRCPNCGTSVYRDFSGSADERA
jgi:hypothetical protein